jgi:hypothetical protein
MQPNPYLAPREPLISIRQDRFRRMLLGVAGIAFFLMPTWVVALRQFHPEPSSWLGDPAAMPRNNVLSRIAIAVGGTTLLVFGVPFAGAGAVTVVSPVSRRTKAVILVALFPLMIIQCLALTCVLVCCGRLSV